MAIPALDDTRRAGTFAGVDFFSVWHSSVDPHLAVIGRHDSGKSATARAIAEHAVSELGGTVMTAAPVVNPYLMHSVDGTHVTGPAATAELMTAALSELDARYTAHEKAPSRFQTLTPLFVILDDYDTLLEIADGEHSRQIVNAAGALLRLGRSVGIHLVVTALTPPFPDIGLRVSPSYVALSTLSHASARLLGFPHLSGQAVDPSLGRGWFVPGGPHQPRAVRFDRHSPARPRRVFEEIR